MKKLIITLISFIVTLLLVITGLRPTQYDISAGKTAPQDIYAPREVVDELTTEKKRSEAEAGLADIYDISEDLTNESRDALKKFFTSVNMQRASLAPFRTETVDGIDIRSLLTMENDAYDAFRSFLESVLEKQLETGVTDRAAAVSEVRETLSASANASLAEKILLLSLRENKVKSPEKTEEARQKLRMSIEPVTYKANQVIVRKGDIVTQAEYEVLLSLGMIKSGDTKVHMQSVLGAVLLVVACFAVLYLYMRRYAHECLKNDGLLLMIAIIFALSILLSSAGVAKTVNPYLLPIIAGTALIAILLDIRFAILYNAVISILSVLIFEGDVYCLSCIMISGTLSAFIFTRAGMRHTLVFSALLQSLCQFGLYFAIGVIEGLTLHGALLRGAYGLASGAISSVFIIGTLPFWEYAFDVTTPFKLLELTNPDQPLLKRLLSEAPGTYHHSLMVGNLAEAASEAIGANALLARTGAYYHDVGKLRRPQYFKENQYAENPHDKMSPLLSASTIISHVKEGTDLARQHRLPSAIRSIIASHHGTTQVAFFFHKAKIENEGDVDEAKFRYKGPRPQTPEEAVVMLADSVEAAVRSLENKDEASIRAMVQKILEGKLSDGQLGESGLTLRDIETIEAAFVHTFCGYFHGRIKYPETTDTKEQTRND